MDHEKKCLVNKVYICLPIFVHHIQFKTWLNLILYKMCIVGISALYLIPFMYKSASLKHILRQDNTFPYNVPLEHIFRQVSPFKSEYY